MEEQIGKITKDDQTNIIIRIDDFGGEPGVTIREFVTSERYTGFTKAGVRIKAQDFRQFKRMINSIDETKFQEDIIPEEVLDILKKKVGEATEEELEKALELVESKIKEIKKKQKRL